MKWSRSIAEWTCVDIAVAGICIPQFLSIDFDSLGSDFTVISNIVSSANIERFGDESSDYFELRITVSGECL